MACPGPGSHCCAAQGTDSDSPLWARRRATKPPPREAGRTFQRERRAPPYQRPSRATKQRPAAADRPLQERSRQHC
eukprot:1467794-Alexandrium_andersonii.AAC.1